VNCEPQIGMLLGFYHDDGKQVRPRLTTGVRAAIGVCSLLYSSFLL
jgi:hypothetical protein